MMQLIIVVVAAIFIPTILCLIGTIISMRIADKTKKIHNNQYDEDSE